MPAVAQTHSRADTSRGPSAGQDMQADLSKEAASPEPTQSEHVVAAHTSGSVEVHAGDSS